MVPDSDPAVSPIAGLSNPLTAPVSAAWLTTHLALSTGYIWYVTWVEIVLHAAYYHSDNRRV